jgi:hypothetical protein
MIRKVARIDCLKDASIEKGRGWRRCSDDHADILGSVGFLLFYG